VKTVDCSREQDVLDALTTGQWPQRAKADLLQHVASCATCADLVLIVRPILEDRDVVPDAAHIPSSGAMWWRAQMRARRETAREAARPITVAQVVGSLAAICLTVALAALLSPWVRSWMAGLSGADALELPRLNVSATLLSQGWWLPLLAIGIWVLIAPVAIYFVVRED
jgi:hypothetical protein